MLIHEMKPLFKDRTEAGERLAQELNEYAGNDTVVLAVPMGGVPVGIEIARRLKADLDLVIVRKIPVPWDAEMGYGAVADDGTAVLNEPMVKNLGLSKAEIKSGIDRVKEEMKRRSQVLQAKSRKVELESRTAIIVDDGLASGFTMTAAIRSVRTGNPASVIVAVPCASHTAVDKVSNESDELVSLVISDMPWFAVASFYENWHDLTYSEVLNLLEEWRSIHQGAV